MELNLSDIVKNEGSKKSFCEQIKIEPVKYSGFEVSFNGDVSLSGSVKNVSGVLELKAEAKGRLATQCARCLESIEKEFCAVVDETLLQEDAENADVQNIGESDVIVFSGYSLPIDEIVLNSILVSMDVKYLCTDDCKGLCSVCGTNLNVAQCNCKSDYIDPRFEVLSKLCDK